MGLFLGREVPRERRMFAPEPPIPPYLGANMTGDVNVASNPDLALTVPTVWACVSLLAGAVSSLPLETFRRTADASSPVPRRITDPKIITKPDDTMTQSEWLHMLLVSLLMRGNAYGIVDTDDNLVPVRVRLLHPDSVRVEVDSDTGALVYRYANSQKIIPAGTMWHVRGLTMPGSRIGLSPIAYAAATLGIDLASRQFASGFFEGGGIPKAVLESDQQVNRDNAQTIKDRVMGVLRNREPLVLGLGLKYTQIQVSPEESQFLATQGANVGQIARYFGVPAAMVGGAEGGSMTYSNREQRSLDFLTYSLAHWLKRIEDAMFSLLPGQQYVRFNVQHILRTDAETQAKVFVQYLAGKVLTPTEVRAELGRDPMTSEQLDEVGMVPLDVTAAGDARINKPQAAAEAATEPGAEPATGLQEVPSAA